MKDTYFNCLKNILVEVQMRRKRVNLYPSKGVPPETRRFCDYCEKETTFKYDRNVLHSVCCECGNRMLKL
jgi:hypothetical protein